VTVGLARAARWLVGRLGVRGSTGPLTTLLGLPRSAYGAVWDTLEHAVHGERSAGWVRAWGLK